MTRRKELPDIPDKEVKKVKTTLTQEDVKELFEYKDGNLYWKNDISTGKYIKIKAGTKAGSINCINKNRNYYKRVTYQRKDYKIPQLIFLMFYGYIPKYVTYKDSDSLNTKIENLIEVNHTDINYRRLISSNNKTGYVGVSFCNKYDKYKSAIIKNRKYVNLGYYNTPEEASKAYEEAKLKYHGTFLDKCKVTNG